MCQQGDPTPSCAKLDLLIGYLAPELRLGFHVGPTAIQQAVLHLFELSGEGLEGSLKFLHKDCGGTAIPLTWM